MWELFSAVAHIRGRMAGEEESMSRPDSEEDLWRLTRHRSQNEKGEDDGRGGKWLNQRFGGDI